MAAKRKRRVKSAEPEIRQWSVPYRVTRCGTATVEARTAEEAEAMVESGDFEESECDERIGWELDGSAEADS